MITDADRYLDERGMPTRPRVTKVGAILRRWSLDELPQLLNILVGDMSVVGPRPLLPSMVARLEPWHMRRFDARPGVTGLAQINGRNAIKVTRRLAFDVEYVERWSLRLDAYILLRTVGVVFGGSGLAIDRAGNDDLPPLAPPPPSTEQS
jgi:lipopolysaccharide/colanic/teichoic acid biosynthesis glycosyltransferase